LDDEVTKGVEQGFVTSEGRFVGRKEALDIAEQAEQKPLPQLSDETELDTSLLRREAISPAPAKPGTLKEVKHKGKKRPKPQKLPKGWKKFTNNQLEQVAIKLEKAEQTKEAIRDLSKIHNELNERENEAESGMSRQERKKRLKKVKEDIKKTIHYETAEEREDVEGQDLFTNQSTFFFSKEERQDVESALGHKLPKGKVGRTKAERHISFDPADRANGWDVALVGTRHEGNLDAYTFVKKLMDYMEHNPFEAAVKALATSNDPSDMILYAKYDMLLNGHPSAQELAEVEDKIKAQIEAENKLDESEVDNVEKSGQIPTEIVETPPPTEDAEGLEGEEEGEVEPFDDFFDLGFDFSKPIEKYKGGAQGRRLWVKQGETWFMFDENEAETIVTDEPTIRTLNDSGKTLKEIDDFSIEKQYLRKHPDLFDQEGSAATPAKPAPKPKKPTERKRGKKEEKQEP
jgi:hypothetical protein